MAIATFPAAGSATASASPDTNFKKSQQHEIIRANCSLLAFLSSPRALSLHLSAQIQCKHLTSFVLLILKYLLHS
jgi:hypothetical protein